MAFSSTKKLTLSSPFEYSTHNGNFTIYYVEVENIRHTNPPNIFPGALGESQRPYLGCTYALLDENYNYVGRYANTFVNTDGNEILGITATSGYDQMVASGITEENLLLNCGYTGTVEDL